MIDLQVNSKEDVAQWARQLWNRYRDNLASFEEAATICVNAIWGVDIKSAKCIGSELQIFCLL